MSWPVIAFWLIVLPPAQSSAVPHVAVDRAAPDLLLLFCLYVGLYVRKPDVWVAAWLVGVMQDVYSQNPIGLHALAYLVLAAAACAIRGEVFKGHLLTRMLLAAGVSLGFGAAGLVVLLAVHRHVSLPTAARHIALSAAYTTLVCPLVYLIFDAARWVACWRPKDA